MKQEYFITNAIRAIRKYSVTEMLNFGHETNTSVALKVGDACMKKVRTENRVERNGRETRSCTRTGQKNERERGWWWWDGVEGGVWEKAA